MADLKLSAEPVHLITTDQNARIRGWNTAQGTGYFLLSDLGANDLAYLNPSTGKGVWVSNTSIKISLGLDCYCENGDRINTASDINSGTLSLSASTWYHVYAYLNSGTPAIEVVTTAPATAYKGTARSKTGNTSRRYLLSIKTDGSGNIYNFQMIGNKIIYDVSPVSAPFRVLSSGTATSTTAVSCSGVVPVTSRLATIYVTNLAGAVVARIHNPASAAAATSVGAGARVMQDMILDSSQNTYYSNNTTGGDTYIDVFGYVFER